MSKLLMFYDTETTGLKDFKAAWNASHQPYLIQLGYKVVDFDTRQVVFEAGYLVDATQMSGYQGIHPDAYNAHKISEESIKKYGLDPRAAMLQFQAWTDQSDLFIAHNDQYDDSIMKCHAFRVDFNPDVFQGKPKVCTMQRSTNICKVPSPRGGYKWPKLIEAYKHLVDPAGFHDAHNALADVNACERIFWSLVDKGYLNLKPQEEMNGQVGM